MDKPIKCDCGKMIAKYKDGKLFVWCKSCKREVEVKIEYPIEPMSRESWWFAALFVLLII